MIIIKIDDMLKSKDKTRYWLAKETNMTYPNLVNLCKGDTASINLNCLKRYVMYLNVILKILLK